MSDFTVTVGEKKKKFAEKLTGSKFVTCAKAPLEFINKGKVFGLVFGFICIVMGVITLVFPLPGLIRVIFSGYFNFGILYTIAFILTWLAVALACWLAFHLWWSRRKKIMELGAGEFIVIPFFAETLKTFGEWLGILLAVIGGLGGLFALIFLGGHTGLLSVLISGRFVAVWGSSDVFVAMGGGLSHYAFYNGIDDMLSGALSGLLTGLFSGLFDGLIGFVFSFPVITGPIAGFLIVLITRFFSESIKVLASIANNTRISAIKAANQAR